MTPSGPRWALRAMGPANKPTTERTCNSLWHIIAAYALHFVNYFVKYESEISECRCKKPFAFNL